MAHATRSPAQSVWRGIMACEHSTLLYMYELWYINPPPSPLTTVSEPPLGHDLGFDVVVFGRLLDEVFQDLLLILDDGAGNAVEFVGLDDGLVGAGVRPAALADVGHQLLLLFYRGLANVRRHRGRRSLEGRAAAQRMADLFSRVFVADVKPEPRLRVIKQKSPTT
eukprot:CAMPEP_0198130440 /NCGR_PEP_ID=MMETSP1442-20131203/54011_1 /TAXON_ID= /ORGANISM="Craspedostauros australis, Strain CCMP3328" /LENGTH=165 /DNA_ID=CAMNT_0043791063 /DNA_START=611 /DNA_END=1105 /DNA_ORIENTATION=-